MIKKLKWKFVCINMLTVSAVLFAIFLAVFLVSRENIRENSMTVLQRVITLDEAPTLSAGNSHVQIPYFTVRIFGDTAYLAGGSYYEFESQQQLQDILDACLAQQQKSGVLEQYDLRYLRADSLLAEKIAFVDTSFEDAMLRSLSVTILCTMLPALLILFALSLFLAGRAVRPVAQAMQQQRQFLSDASHELKTPLTVILSNVDLLEEELPAGESLRWLGNIEAESQKMKSLVEEMLTLERTEGVQTPVFSTLSLSELVMEEILRFEPLAFEAGKPLQETLTEELSVCGSSEGLHHTVSVLLDNAIRYGLAGESITVTLRSEGRKALLTVSNAAAPMTEEQLRLLFRRFYRADSSRGEQKGFGLGLPIAKAVAEQHGGELRADYANGRLSFTLTLPLK